MTEKDPPTEDDENFEEDLIIEEEDEAINDEVDNDDKGEEPLFPFDKMPFQEKGENVADIHDYEMGSNQELNLGESDKRTKRRTLRDERGAGHEP